MTNIYAQYYGHVRAPQNELCTFFTVELPWAFGKRLPGMGRHLPIPWWGKLKIRKKSTARSRRRLRRVSKRGTK